MMEMVYFVICLRWTSAGMELKLTLVGVWSKYLTTSSKPQLMRQIDPVTERLHAISLWPRYTLVVPISRA